MLTNTQAYKTYFTCAQSCTTALNYALVNGTCAVDADCTAGTLVQVTNKLVGAINLDIYRCSDDPCLQFATSITLDAANPNLVTAIGPGTTR